MTPYIRFQKTELNRRVFFNSDHDNNPDSRGACGQIKTLHLQMTQTDFLHEVQLKCVLETVNPRGPPKVLEDVATIKVVPSKLFLSVLDYKNNCVSK